MGQPASSRREQVRAEAAAWVVRLSDPASGPRERAAFEAWRDADPSHEAAYEREAAAWGELDRLRAYRPTGVAEPDADLFVHDHARPARRRLLRPRWAAAAAAAVAVSTAGAVWMTALATPAYATGVGERRVVVLADGTRLELNTDTKVVVHYRGGLRKVRLVRGEALFHVAPDRRAFVVETPDGDLKAFGGELAVRIAGDGAARVTVRQGRVEAEREAGRPTVAIPAATVAVVAEGGASLRPVTPDEVERTLAWRQGAIALNGQTLAEAVAEFNRYNTRQVSIADPATAALRVGGYFQTSDLTGFVQAVTEAFPVAARQAPDGGIILSRAG
jgi:transmembrane sensor